MNCGLVILFIDIRDRVTAIWKGPSALPRLVTNHGMISHYGYFTVTASSHDRGELEFPSLRTKIMFCCLIVNYCLLCTKSIIHDMTLRT